MKKSVLLGTLALAFAASPAFAELNEVEVFDFDVTQVEAPTFYDCSQGRLINKNKDNWFITIEGGADMLFGRDDIHANIKDRIDGAGALYVGKWISPIFGFRFGANYVMTKGATTEYGFFRKWNAKTNPIVKNDEPQNGFYQQKWMGVGPEFDVMVSLTNWWCGYRPNRVYNAVVHGGAGAYWRWKYSNHNNQYNPNSVWECAHNTIMFASLGLQQNFRLSKHVDFFIDLQYELIDESYAAEHMASAFLGFNFNLGKTDWNCPIVAEITAAPSYTEEMRQMEKKIDQLELTNDQLETRIKEECNKTAPSAPQGDCSQLVTIYYPINQYDLSSREKKVLQSVADVMLAHPSTTYEVVGWADNWTGSKDYNVDLRWNRVNTVKNYLISCGVPESQLRVNIDNSNLVNTEDYSEFNAEVIKERSAPLDRAVTIRIAK